MLYKINGAMGRKCCVPGCKSGYGTVGNGAVMIHRFPQDENLRKTWIRAIPRDEKA